MASHSGPPPGFTRPKNPKSPQPQTTSSPSHHVSPPIMSPAPRRAASASWALSLAAGLFPPTFMPPVPSSTPHGTQPAFEAVPSMERLCQPPLMDNSLITDLAVFPAPLSLDPWHIAHARVCAHATAPCAACSVAFVCCSCRALRFTPGTAPIASPPPPLRSRSVSPTPSRNVGSGLHSLIPGDASARTLFRFDVGNGPSPPGFHSHCDEHDDDAYVNALAECDTCDNSSCPRGANEPATYSITVEQFDEGSEETYERVFRACSACNRSCKKSFMGHRIKTRVFDNSAREALKKLGGNTATPPGSASYAYGHPAAPMTTVGPTHSRTGPDSTVSNFTAITALQDALRILNDRPPTPAAFVATVRVKHDAMCSHSVISCPACSLGLVCCACKALFAPAIARHLTCTTCKHTASSCCTSAYCCKCSKIWMPSDTIVPVRLPARRFFGGAGSRSTSSPEPDIWTPSPRSSPDEIDDLTVRANIPLPASRQESDSSRAPSRASSVSEPVNVAATPLPTPDYSSIPDDSVEGFIHPSFPERAVLDSKDKRHFLGRGDLSVTSLKLYARRIFTETSHWVTAGHFLVDIFQGATLNGSRDDFRRFVILVGTQLGYGDLAQSMSESLDVNRKMADEYMRLRDVATSWKQKAKANSKDARAGRKAQDDLSKAREDITAILEEREIFIQQRRELLARDDQLTTELNRVHQDYGNAIEDNTKFAANIETLEQDLALAKDELNNTKNALSIAEHHRDKAERDCGDAVLRFDKAEAERKRDKAFYEARITALSNPSVPTSQPDSEEPIRKAAVERAALLQKLDNLTKELSVRDAELAKLRSEVSLSTDVNVLRAELAEAKAVAARLSGMYEQKSKDFRDSEIERLALLGKQILSDGNAPKETPPARPRPAPRRGRQRSRSTGRDNQAGHAAAPPAPSPSASGSKPSSQPFWQDEPLFTKHVAAVTTTTMSALPHLPFETAIAAAFNTVWNVGPPPPLKLDKKPGNRRSGAPSPPTPSPAAAPQNNFTFADIAKAATTNAPDAKKKPSWRAIETSKALVLRPSTKGTRVSELHLKVPKTAESADLFKLKGSALLERIAKLISDHSEPAPRMALRENPLVFVKWSMRGNLVLKCAKPMDDLIKEGIKDAIAYFFPSPSAEILILNKPPTTALKFLAVPRHNIDGSDTDDMDLLNDLTTHPAWADVELWSNPKFINLKAGMAGATVVVSVVDDNQGNVGRRLMGTMVEFSGFMGSSGCTLPR
ncbi:hypothetical protein AX14_004417 [Amanita brunnescens Koide BX004]|nr:hypothetical protein AX14_004417 [Amanita brunnescens Koide BX004]